MVNDCEENMEAIRDIYSEFNGMQEADQNIARQMMDRMKEIIKQNGNPVRVQIIILLWKIIRRWKCF